MDHHIQAPEIKKCKRCSWQWIPRVMNPAVCPRCHSYQWDVAPTKSEYLKLVERNRQSGRQPTMLMHDEVEPELTQDQKDFMSHLKRKPDQPLITSQVEV